MEIPIEVSHNESGQRFEALVDGQLAYCEYRRSGTVLHLDYTAVPRAHQGHGIAATLVKAALAYARANGLEVVPGCSYVRTYMQRHPETLDLIRQHAPQRGVG